MLIRYEAGIHECVSSCNKIYCWYAQVQRCAGIEFGHAYVHFIRYFECGLLTSGILVLLNQHQIACKLNTSEDQSLYETCHDVNSLWGKPFKANSTMEAFKRGCIKI